jgi:heme A synthase
MALRIRSVTQRRRRRSSRSVKHMATLAEGLQISQPVIGGIVVKVRGRQHDPGCANSDVVAN